MLTYTLGGYNTYNIRTKPIASNATHLRLTTQNMTTLQNYPLLFNPGQWSYNRCESIATISFNLEIPLNDCIVGTEYRIGLTPYVSGSGYLDDVWFGSMQVFTSQSIDKANYENQIPLDNNELSYASANDYIIYYEGQQPPISTTTTSTTTTTAAPTTTTTTATPATTTTTSTTTAGPTTTTTTGAPGTPNVIFTFGNQIGAMGYNVCWSATNSLATGVGVSHNTYSLFMSSDNGCTTPYGTSWNLNSGQGAFIQPGIATGSFSSTSGGQIDNGNYYRTRISGSFQFDVPGLGIPFSPIQTYDLSANAYQDLTWMGVTVRIQGPNCTLNNQASC